MDDDKIYKAAEVFTGLSPVKNIKPYGKGHIHKTYLVETAEGRQDYILQKINRNVFKDEDALLHNYKVIRPYLKHLIPEQCTDKNNQFYHYTSDECWRAFKFIENTISHDVVESPDHAYEASKIFGKFIRLLRDVYPEEIKETIPDFHNLTFRYACFEEVRNNKNKESKKASEAINSVETFTYLIDRFREFKIKVPLRIVHNDAKLNNILFDQKELKAIAITDLDTIMPGPVWNDFGDMVRTYVPDLPEDADNFEAMKLKKEFFNAMVKGFLSQTGSVLSLEEKEMLYDGALFIIYEQALRFLTDYLEGDLYYPTKYPEQNLIRAFNQLTLLRLLIKEEDELRQIVKNVS